jgi:hypothetical protein
LGRFAASKDTKVRAGCTAVKPSKLRRVNTAKCMRTHMHTNTHRVARGARGGRRENRGTVARPGDSSESQKKGVEERERELKRELKRES